MQTISERKALKKYSAMRDQKDSIPRREPYVGRLVIGCLLILLVAVVMA